MALLRYALNDGVNPVVVKNSWIVETYNRPLRIVNGMVRTNDELEIFALCQRGFVIVKEDKKPKKQSESLETTLRKMSRSQLNQEAGRFGLTQDAENYKNKDELVAAILAVNDEE